MQKCAATGAALALLLGSLSAALPGHRSGSVHVHGYTTRSGHYVAPYTRSAPHSSFTHAPGHGGSTSPPQSVVTPRLARA